MKKMTITILALLLVIILQNGAIARNHQSRSYPDTKNHGTSIKVIAAPMTVTHRMGKQHKLRRCFPATMKTWINGGQPTTVQITVCKKKGGWIASPLYVTLGRERVTHNNERWNSHRPIYEPVPYLGNPVYPQFIR